MSISTRLAISNGSLGNFSALSFTSSSSVSWDLLSWRSQLLQVQYASDCISAISCEKHLLFKQLKLLTLNKIHDVESNVFEKLDFYLIILRYLHVVKCMHVSIEILHMCDINGKLTLQGNFMLVSPFMNNYFYKQKCRQTIHNYYRTTWETIV